MQKIQYSMPDLANALGIQGIREAYLHEEGGQVYLRISCDAGPSEDQYKTVKVPEKKKSPAAKPRTREASSAKKEPYNLLGKVGAGVAAWAAKPMKRPDQW